MTLKIYNLACVNEHLFEGWFSSAEDFSNQLKDGRLTCPVCGDTRIDRRPAMPHFGAVRGTVRDSSHDDNQSRKQSLQGAAMRIIRQIAISAEDVGDNFEHEVRAMHDGKAKSRTLKGRCSIETAQKLQDDGIDLLPLPEGFDKPLN